MNRQQYIFLSTKENNGYIIKLGKQVSTISTKHNCDSFQHCGIFPLDTVYENYVGNKWLLNYKIPSYHLLIISQCYFLHSLRLNTIFDLVSMEYGCLLFVYDHHHLSNGERCTLNNIIDFGKDDKSSVNIKINMMWTL